MDTDSCSTACKTDEASRIADLTISVPPSLLTRLLERNEQSNRCSDATDAELQQLLLTEMGLRQNVTCATLAASGACDIISSRLPVAALCAASCLRCQQDLDVINNDEPLTTTKSATLTLNWLYILLAGVISGVITFVSVLICRQRRRASAEIHVTKPQTGPFTATKPQLAMLPEPDWMELRPTSRNPLTGNH